MSVVRGRTRTPAAPDLTWGDVEALSAALHEPSWLLERRRAAWQVYESLPMPTTRDEEWRRTDYRRIRWAEAGTLLTPLPGADLGVIPAHHYAPLLGDRQGGLMAFVDASIAAQDIDAGVAEQGVIFTDLHTAVRQHGDLVQEYLMTQAVLPEHGKFAALHTALWTHGTFLYVPRGVAASLPLHSVFYPRSAGMTLGHILVVLEDGAEATYMHEYASPTLDQDASFVGATEMVLGTGTRLNYVALQDWGRSLYEFSHQRARVARDASIDWVHGTMGGKLTKLFMEIELDGEGSSCRMSGLYFGDGMQVMDHDTQQNHNAPHTTSDLLFKGALKDEARSVWQGMIMVKPGAQQTDGFQANRNLVLSRDARADSIPGLEISADDVRCTHAATVSQLDEEPLYYLMSRGIPRAEAEKLAVDGFFGPIMERIPFEGVRERLQGSIEAKLLGTAE
ncbi:MAG: Fe-S cluster assembly protein SufD [Anaerolineae bacterium]|nr:Fe-S cluster assembly protein SufD [Anaerolineae bacterium]